MVSHYSHKGKQLLLLLIYFSGRRNPTTRSPLLTDVSGTKSLHLELMLIKTGGGGGAVGGVQIGVIEWLLLKVYKEITSKID